MKIFVVDNDKVIENSSAYAGVKPEMDEMTKKYQELLKKMQDKVASKIKAFEAERAVLSKEADAKKQDRLNNEIREIEQTVYQSKLQMDQTAANAIMQIEQALIKVIADYASENKVDLVLTKGVLFYAKDNLDITNAIVTKLNAALPKVQIQEVKKQDETKKVERK